MKGGYADAVDLDAQLACEALELLEVAEAGIVQILEFEGGQEPFLGSLGARVLLRNPGDQECPEG